MRSRSRIKRLRDQKLDKRYQQRLEETTGKIDIYESLEENVQFIKKTLGESFDLVTKRLFIEQAGNHKAIILYLDTMINKELIHNYLIRPLITQSGRDEAITDVWSKIVEAIVESGETKPTTEMKLTIDALLNGDTVLFVDGFTKALIVASKGWYNSPREPRSESVVRGPRDGLTETLVFNISMIRHRLKDPHLRIKSFTIGKRTQTLVNLLYIDDVADPSVVEEASKRIGQIKIDGILETGYVEEFIQDQTWSPFPQLQNTERPDVVVAHLLEGKVAILVDGTPHALIAPAVFTQFYYSPEDYYERYYISSFLRIVRLIGVLIALLLPAVYIALVAFHPELFPSDLVMAMAAGRSAVPFNAILEALVMELSVEVLREASIRLPGPIGPTIGIVGALVIGNTAVEANLVSPAIVIVVGLTTISSYANPSYNGAISIRLLRFPIMIAASLFGLYGIILALMVLVTHLVQLSSFGVAYMAPYAPSNLPDLKDTLVRVPWTWMKRRPEIYNPQKGRRSQVVEGGK